ncbi:MAG: hypothetical protein H6590_06280 [Flavobacteriales bacterium]|nr:hypothetical protein [Flavobacteriales bacterium]
MRHLLAILIATVWISIHEFVRNQLVLADHWAEHYAAMGLAFPSAPVNGAVWGIWALVLVIAIHFLARRGGLLETAAIAWIMGFVLMWLVIGNMGVLPLCILPVAVPWSMVEVIGAVYIVQKFRSRVPSRQA